MTIQTVTQVVEVLYSLYHSNDSQTIKEANRWLESFQKKIEAWEVAEYLFSAENSNFESRLFAIQTIKQKVSYDLRDLDVEARFRLRDSLLNMLISSTSQPRAILIQLSLAITDLAIQLLQWNTVIPDLILKLGKTPKTLNCLLEILKILPEELEENTRLPLTNAEFKLRGSEIIENNSREVLDLLVKLTKTNELNLDLQENVFKCLSSWIRTRRMDMKVVSASPFLELSFISLKSPELFDAAVDVISEIITETRDVTMHQSLIQQIYSSFSTLLLLLDQCIEEEDDASIRGYCRIFVEAGEAYLSLIGDHPDAFKTLLDGILKCSAYNELDIASMTFKFWYDLTYLLQTDESIRPYFILYYDALVDIMMRHLQYPEDIDAMTAEQKDDLSDFRHQMGDTLKDCCLILSPQRCLIKPMELLTRLLNNSKSTWQQIEAPLFSLRVMGSEVPRDEDQVMPHIMEFLKQLPDHPKIRYATTLVISRYSFWTDCHPQFITFQLNFISSGFQNNEVAAASALALRNLCKDCRGHLIGFIPQLHEFYLNVSGSLSFRDVIEVTEAVSHVMSVIPEIDLENALQLFCLPVAKELHRLISVRRGELSSRDFYKIGDLLEQISIFFKVIKPEIPLDEPHPCVSFLTELWPIFDAALSNFGELTTISEPLCKCFSNFISSYGLHFIPLLKQLMERLVAAYQSTGLSSYLWVSFKLVREYSNGNGEQPCFEFIQRISQYFFVQIQHENLNDIPDVVEEYFHLIFIFLENSPSLLIQNSMLSTIFQAGLAGLSIKEKHALKAILIFYRRLLLHEITFGLFREFGNYMVSILFDGLTEFYHKDSILEVSKLIKLLAENFPHESTMWTANAVNLVPQEYMSIETKNDFMSHWSSSINEQQWDRATEVLCDFVSTYRRRNANSRR